jgi:hypothetical protein
MSNGNGKSNPWKTVLLSVIGIALAALLSFLGYLQVQMASIAKSQAAMVVEQNKCFAEQKQVIRDLDWTIRTLHGMPPPEPEEDP